VLQCRIPWQAAKVVPEPRPTNLGPLRALSLTQRFIEDDMSRQLATSAANCRLYEKQNKTNIGQ
jgi:hypothetical protein